MAVANSARRAPGRDRSGGRGNVLQIGPAVQVGTDPRGGRPGQREALAQAMLAGHPEHGAFLISTEVLDVSPDDLGHPGASEQQNRDQRSGTGSLRSLHQIGGVHEREKPGPG